MLSRNICQGKVLKPIFPILLGALFATHQDLYGFSEQGSFSENRAKFRLTEDLHLECDSAAGGGRRQYVGEFSTPTLAELREQLEEFGPQEEPLGGSLHLRSFQQQL